jgi:DNA helicase-2/ATP-dependent DNA helicase PcrA
MITLTDEQQRIIEAPAGHYLVTAVAGSGKTTTLAHRIRYLLDHGTQANRMLVLMFNRAAKMDFEAKLSSVLQGYNTQPEIRTFHAMGYRLYQRFVKEGYLRPFQTRILSDHETLFQLWLLARRIIPKEQEAELKRNKKEHMSLALQFIEAVKGQLASPEDVFKNSALGPQFQYFLPLFEAFERWRKQSSRISYADMLYDPVRALLETPQLCELVSNKMDVVLVDEYQDTNEIQHTLLTIIAGGRADITIVGDPDQTIYEFRGAKPAYMISGFAKEYEQVNTLDLSYTFRYGHRVALLANHLICNNSERRNILCQAHAGNPRTSAQLHQTDQELNLLASLVQANEHQDNSAILVRAWSQTIGIELSLLSHNIPYRMAQQKGVFNSEELLAIEALIQLASGVYIDLPRASRQQKFYQLLRFPHVGLPDTTLTELSAQLAAHQSDWGRHLLAAIPDNLIKIQTLKLERLARTLGKISISTNVAGMLTLYIQDTGLYEGIRTLSFNTEYGEERVEAIKAIVRFVSTLKGSANEVLAQLETLRQSAERKTESGIQVTTIHRAKGLEWHTVYIPGFNARHYPYNLRKQQIEKSEIKSERRLLYVAMTRAKQGLHIFSPSQQRSDEISRFQAELRWNDGAETAEQIENIKQGCSGNTHSAIAQRYAKHYGLDLPLQSKASGLPHSEDKEIWFIERIRHRILGTGTVINEKGNAFTVRFDDQEERVFSKEQAPRFFEAI